jgi:hypothetical protein
MCLSHLSLGTCILTSFQSQNKAVVMCHTICGINVQNNVVMKCNLFAVNRSSFGYNLVGIDIVLFINYNIITHNT